MQYKSYVFICKLKTSIALRNISFEVIDRSEALRMIETQVTIFQRKVNKATTIGGMFSDYFCSCPSDGMKKKTV